MSDSTIIWFRKDLRIQDNPALNAAISQDSPIIPLFILSDEEEQDWPAGGASRWWLHQALTDLRNVLADYGHSLLIRRGSALDELKAVINDSGASRVYWNRRYEPAIIKRDSEVKKTLREDGVEVESFNASLIWEPHTVSKRDGDPFRVFTPFWKHLRTLSVPPPENVEFEKIKPRSGQLNSLDLEELSLLPDIPWDSEFSDHWQPDLAGAHDALQGFVDETVSNYQKFRDHPSKPATSRLSPYLASGQLGPRQVWAAMQASGNSDSNDGFKFLSEIAWREFAYHLLYHFPKTPTRPLSSAYDHFPWQEDDKLLAAWQSGETGYPIVDAGMRQLWRTGWMHNRVRMVVASLLVKHLLQPWQSGARWFWDTLVDADLASNTMGWQWSAGCGADAAPYFRIFNPTLQGEKFDSQGEYIRRWVPELSKLPERWIHEPWSAPPEVLSEAEVSLGKHYPHPVIDHKDGRQRALDALARNKKLNQEAEKEHD